MFSPSLLPDPSPDLDLDLDVDRDLDLDLGHSDGSPAADELDIPAARCADGTGSLTSLFFSDDPLDIARAKAICLRCERRERCLDEALARAEPAGVWGGQLLRDGVIVALKRPCGRPPKHPRPPLFVDELGEIRHDPADGRAVAVFATG